MAGSRRTKAVDRNAARLVEQHERREGTFLAYLRRTGVRKGIRGNSRFWLYVAVATWVFRTLRRMARRKPEVLLLEELKPGERVIVANNRSTVDVG